MSHQTDTDAGAVISPDEAYRFALWRTVTPLSKPSAVCFVMANPSTADSQEDDPTIRRIKVYAATWGFRKAYVVNVNPCRATSPKDAWIPPEEILVENDRWIRQVAKACQLVVCAWGTTADPLLVVRAWKLIENLRPTALALNAGGSPAHPLYLKAELRPVRIRAELSHPAWKAYFPEPIEVVS